MKSSALHKHLKNADYSRSWCSPQGAIRLLKPHHVTTSVKKMYTLQNYLREANLISPAWAENVVIPKTTAETNIIDCYGLIRLLTPEAYSSKANFEYVHCVKEPMPLQMMHMAKTIHYRDLDRLHDNLYAQARRVLKKDVSDLPPRLFTEYLVSLSPKHLALYNQIVEERMLEIDEELIDMTTAQALYQATQQILLNPEKKFV
jgi:hypothetical protein